MSLRSLVYDTGGRRFVFALYVVTLTLVSFTLLRWLNLIPVDTWEPTVGAVWKVAGAFLGAFAVEDVATAVAKTRSAPTTTPAPQKSQPGGEP